MGEEGENMVWAVGGLWGMGENWVKIYTGNCSNPRINALIIA